MKASRHILSNNGIFAVTAILLTIATFLALASVVMQVQAPSGFVTTISPAAREHVTLYVMSGVMGEIPSIAGTLQSFSLAVAYGITPLVVISMFAARAVMEFQPREDYVAA